MENLESDDSKHFNKLLNIFVQVVKQLMNLHKRLGKLFKWLKFYTCRDKFLLSLMPNFKGKVFLSFQICHLFIPTWCKSM